MVTSGDDTYNIVSRHIHDLPVECLIYNWYSNLATCVANSNIAGSSGHKVKPYEMP